MIPLCLFLLTLSLPGLGGCDSVKEPRQLESPAPGTDPLWPNEPSGLRLFTDNPWSSLTPPGWTVSQSPYIDIAQDPSDPASPPFVLRRTYPRGLPDGSSPGGNWFMDVGGTRELYVGFYIRFVEGFTPHRLGMKLAHFMFQDGPGNIFIDWVTPASHPGVRRLLLNLSGWGGRVDHNVVDGPDLEIGRWYLVEVQLRFNDPGRENGILKLWTDGVLNTEQTSVAFPARSFSNFHFSGTWGGGGVPVPHDQHVHIGHTRISGR
jgi:hypothetical protein